MTIAGPPPDDAATRKSRGAFFTPPLLAQFVARWAVRSPGDAVLEPSCGDAAFLAAAAARLDALGAPADAVLHGIEIHPPSAAAARQRVAAAGRTAAVEVADFFGVPSERRFDAVLGNPPYVRYQDHAGAARAASRAAALRAGVGLTALASTWAAATVHAAEFLRPGGRLGLVLPAELLTVNYAADVRRYLMRRFGRVRLVMFTERVFPGVLEEVVLLLADDALAAGGTDHAELHQVSSVAELHEELSSHRWWPDDSGAKWTPALVPSDALASYTAAVAGPSFVTLHEWGETTLGAVTGRNGFFALSPARAAELRLRADETLRLSPPGSRHLRGLSMTTAGWRALGDAGSATLLFRPGADIRAMSVGARRYIAHGVAAGVDRAYKCRVRNPWWQVPVGPPADLLLTYMNADTPRLTTNAAAAVHLNSVHGVYLRAAHAAWGRALLPVASLNSVTLLGAELVGRAYGGGLLKLEPREADLLPVPAPAVVAGAAAALRRVTPTVRRALHAGELLTAVRAVDKIVLGEVSDAARDDIVAARALLAARRAARGSRPREP
ncbi:N-6 DNA methylase [Mycobacterium sp. MYCO198283]|uniref:N-6 DNA methylase n=1 Tax=Mycobacterium sp. MYCO198283 TaxID=2883505 RepID=UPI001E399F85|nr:N-6 DNA methylase [Mycobacterium sp. MYCO198283]MCG5432968.1 N-6 DNA methylase [Mycobacterium sp. MYCO198283]